MKILIVNAVFSQGGAARAALSLHRGLLAHGEESFYLTNYADVIDPTVIATHSQFRKKINSLRYFGDQLPFLFYPKKNSMFSPNLFPSGTFRRINRVNADIVHLNWVNNGFLDIGSLAKIQKPLVWTMHDMWGMTGGCHYDRGCGRWLQGCGYCPQLGSQAKNDWSHRTWRAKEQSWMHVPMTIVCPSQWLANTFKESPLFKDKHVCVINNGLDTQIWRPKDKNDARKELGLPLDKKLILLLAQNVLEYKYKGIDILRKAIELMEDCLKKDLCLVIVGADHPNVDLEMPCQTICKGFIKNDEVLRSFYSAADVTAFPSYPEALGFVAMESMACATPVVAFDSGGVIDMIEHKKNGYLAPSWSEQGFLDGLKWALTDTAAREESGRQARRTIEEKFDIRMMVEKYLELYKNILGQR